MDGLFSFSTIKEFVGFGLEIISALDKAEHNAEDCRRIRDLLLSLRAIAKQLQESPKMMEDNSMRGTAEGLRKALQRASEFVAKCKRKGLLSRAFYAKGIAEKLRGVCLDLLLNINAVLLANSALNTSLLANLEENMAQLRADFTSAISMLAKILQIVDLPQEVTKLVEDYQISSQTKKNRETKKTDVPSFQNKNKGEAKETDVARTEVKNQKKNKKLGRSTVVPDASLPDGLAESASAASVVGQGSSTIVAARPDVDLPEEVEKLVKDDQISFQTKNKGGAKKTAVASSQNKNNGEAKKTDVARTEVKNQKKNKKLGRSTVVPDASLRDGLPESASATSVVGPSTISINKASSSISKSVDEAQSVGVSAAPFHPQKIISISEEPGETGRYKIDPHSSMTSKLLEVYPQQLLFPLDPKNKETTRCPVTLTNNTDHYVGIWIKPINGRFKETEIMEARSTLVVYATMGMHAQPPKDTVKFEVLMIIMRSKRDHITLKSSIVGKLNMDSRFMVHVKNLKAEVYQAMLTAITCDPPSCEIISRSIKKLTLVTSIDAHPTKPWIVTGHEGGNFSIWDYQTKETVMALQVNKVPGRVTGMIHDVTQYIKETPVQHSVYSVKFTAEGKWLVVGDGHGYIYVYDSTDSKLPEVKKFSAYDKTSVNSLAAHPTKPYLLLSSSSFSRNIKLWDSSENWKFQNFKVKPEDTYYVGVHSVKFNPRDTNTFACVTEEDRVKVWNIKPSNLETTLKGTFVMADYFSTRGHEHLMVTLRSGSHNSEIWNLTTQEVVHTLSVSGHQTTWVACHPKHPILVTMLDDGTVCFWDASTYRLEKMVRISNSKCRDLVFVPETNGPPRLAIAFETMIAIMEVNLPIANTSNASGLIMGTN